MTTHEHEASACGRDRHRRRAGRYRCCRMRRGVTARRTCGSRRRGIRAGRPDLAHRTRYPSPSTRPALDRASRRQWRVGPIAVLRRRRASRRRCVRSGVREQRCAGHVVRCAHRTCDRCARAVPAISRMDAPERDGDRRRSSIAQGGHVVSRQARHHRRFRSVDVARGGVADLCRRPRSPGGGTDAGRAHRAIYRIAVAVAGATRSGGAFAREVSRRTLRGRNVGDGQRSAIPPCVR